LHLRGARSDFCSELDEEKGLDPRPEHCGELWSQVILDLRLFFMRLVFNVFH